MSYIKCLSYIKNKEVDYGLIDVKLKHKALDSDYGALNPGYYFNTSPARISSDKVNDNFSNIYSDRDNLPCETVSGKTGSGVLLSDYGYVTRGKHPIISNSIYNVEDMELGYNTFDLFETDYVKFELQCFVAKVSDFLSTSSSVYFKNLDGDDADESLKVIATVAVVSKLKQNEQRAGYFEILDKSYINAVTMEFTVNTELFRIQDFNPIYASYYYYDTRRYNYYDADSGTGNQILTSNGLTSEKNDIIGITFSIMNFRYWSPSGRNYNTYYERKVVNSDKTELTESEKKNMVTAIHTGYMLHTIDTDPDTFINFIVDQPGAGQLCNSVAGDYIEDIYNSEGKYGILSNVDGEVSFSSTLTFPFFMSPILLGYMNSDLTVRVSGLSGGVYISLTDTVYDGDPSSDDDDDDGGDDGGDDEWDPPYDYIEPADDVTTEYTPVLPGWITAGHKTYTYPGDDIISGDPAAYNLYRPSYSNYVFKRYYRKTTEWDQDSAWEFVNDCTNASISTAIRDAFKLVTGHPTIGEIVARVYELPFEYSELINTSAAYNEASPVYGYVGFIACSFNGDGEMDQDDVRWYKRLTNRFYPIELGSINIQKVFDNYLDYTDTRYKLNLPYGAGVVEIDPSFLFNVGRVTANIHIKGFLDVDTGFLIIKVIINNQLYYETSVNVAVDRLATSSDNLAVPLTLTKLIGGSAVAPQITSQIARSRYLEQSAARVEERRQIEEIKTEEGIKRQREVEESTMRVIDYRAKRGI